MNIDRETVARFETLKEWYNRTLFRNRSGFRYTFNMFEGLLYVDHVYDNAQSRKLIWIGPKGVQSFEMHKVGDEPWNGPDILQFSQTPFTKADESSWRSDSRRCSSKG